MGKGSRSRITDKAKFDAEYDRIYGKRDFIEKARISYEKENEMIPTRKRKRV